MDEGERAFFEASQDGWNLRDEFNKKRTISWRKVGPSQKSGQILLNFVSAHVVVVGKTFSILQCRGVP